MRGRKEIEKEAPLVSSTTTLTVYCPLDSWPTLEEEDDNKSGDFLFEN